MLLIEPTASRTSHLLAAFGSLLPEPVLPCVIRLDSPADGLATHAATDPDLTRFVVLLSPIDRRSIDPWSIAPAGALCLGPRSMDRAGRARMALLMLLIRTLPAFCFS
jgi:hypothetical protein